MKRIISLLLAFCLLTSICTACAEPFSTAYHLSFEMASGPDAGITALADLLNMLEISGTYAAEGVSFRLEATVELDGNSQTDTGAVVWGLDTHWAVDTPLLGGVRLMLNHLATLEYAVKIYNHVGFQLQRLALLYPPATLLALREPAEEWNQVFHAEEGERNIDMVSIRSLSETILEMAYENQGPHSFLSAVGMETGLDEVITGLIEALPDWIEEWSEGEGIMITEEEGVESWTCGEVTLYSRESGEEGTTVQIFLPGVVEDGDLSFIYEQSAEGDFSVGLQLGEDGSLLSVNIAGSSLPLHLCDAEEPFSLDMTVSGYCLEQIPLMMMDEEAGSLTVREWTEDDVGHWTLNGDSRHLTVSDGENNLPIVTVHTDWTPWTANEEINYDQSMIDGINFYSLNDQTLQDLLDVALKPAIKGIIPVISAAPASTCTYLMNWLEETGLLTMEGFSLPEGETEEY